MDDAELDRALNATLSVSPSPEFVARVRRAIADEPVASPVGRWLVPACALAVLMTAVGLMTFVFRPTVPAEVPPEIAARAASVLPSVPIELYAPAPSPRVEAESVTPLLIRRAPTLSEQPARLEFQVMVSASDAAAYQRLFANVGSMPYELSDEPTGQSEYNAIAAIDFSPIVIPPLNDASPAGGVFQ
jgi:hypothetical protein